MDANLANAQMLAQTRGRWDELANAQAQSHLLHRVVDFICSTPAETNMANAKQRGEQEADAIHTPAIAQQQNSEAMGANDLLAVANAKLAHAESSLRSVEVQLANATAP